MTMVMREMPGSAVWPTLSDSMLRTRRRTSDATRFSTPGLSSTRTTRVCCTELDRVVCRFDQHRRLGPSNHRVEIGARGHHRVDTVFLLDAEVDEHRSFGVPRPLDDVLEARAVVDAHAEQTVRLGDLHDVGAEQR